MGDFNLEDSVLNLIMILVVSSGLKFCDSVMGKYELITGQEVGGCLGHDYIQYGETESHPNQ